MARALQTLPDKEVTVREGAGRPPVVVDLAAAKKAGLQGLTFSLAAAVLGISEMTIYRQPEILLAFQRGRAERFQEATEANRKLVKKGQSQAIEREYKAHQAFAEQVANIEVTINNHRDTDPKDLLDAIDGEFTVEDS